MKLVRRFQPACLKNMHAPLLYCNSLLLIRHVSECRKVIRVTVCALNYRNLGVWKSPAIFAYIVVSFKDALVSVFMYSGGRERVLQCCKY